MTGAPSLRAGRTAWRITPGADSGFADRVLRCVVVRLLRDGHVEVAPSLLSPARLELPASEVFADRDIARAEARRRRDATEASQ